MKKTTKKGHLPGAKQVKISAFFPIHEKATEMHSKCKSESVIYTDWSENKNPETLRDILDLKCHSESEVDYNEKCTGLRSPMQLPYASVIESSPLSEKTNCTSVSTKTESKTNLLSCDFILPTPENQIHKNKKSGKVCIRKVKRKLPFIGEDNGGRKDKFLKCDEDLDKRNSDRGFVLADTKRDEELKPKNMKFSSGTIGLIISDGSKCSYGKCPNILSSDVRTVNNCEISSVVVQSTVFDVQDGNSCVNDKLDCTRNASVQNNILDINNVNNSVQLNFVGNMSSTHGAEFGQSSYTQNNGNTETVTNFVTGTEADPNTSEDKGPRMLKNNLTLDTTVHCNVVSIERLVHEVILDVQACYADNVIFKCILRGIWVNTKINIGDHVLITTPTLMDEPKFWVIDNDSGSIILYPDFLISGTSVVNSLFCMRRSVLSNMFRGLDADSRGMVIGTLLHQILQQVLKRQVQLVDEISKIVTEILLNSDTLFSLYASKMTMEETRKGLEAFVPRIHSFVQSYLCRKRSSEGLQVCSPNVWEGEITSIVDIEENIWVPKLGLKGKVDVTVKTRIGSKEKLMPLELKTGRATFSAEHYGQVILYIMMMKELGYSVDSGLLLYLREGVMKEINFGHSEYRDLVSLRNELVYSLHASQHISYADSGKRIVSPHLPEPINHHSACAKCPYLTVCSSALMDNGLDQLPENNVLFDLSKKSTSHLKKEHIDYVFHWTGLLQMEYKEVQRVGSKISDIWFLSPSEREKNGNCLPNLSHVGTVKEISPGHYEHMFFSVNTSKCPFVEGDYLIVSSDARTAVASGIVTSISDNYITLDLERDLSRSGDNWHLDKYVSQSLNVFNISNLGLLLDDTQQAARLRQGVISLELPKFAPKLSSKVLKLGNDLLHPLNSGQKSAIFKALAADHYVLFKGMPGTGKTATIICLILLAVRLDLSILITSHTHSAIDNILLRLKGKVDFLRLGSSHRIHCDLLPYSEETHICSDPHELENFYNNKPVVAVTCFGCGHPLLQHRQFDICIVDEATQVLQPSVLRALFSAKKFILVGDPDQMPPLVRSSEASKLGLGDSLFTRLDRPAVTAELSQQYRMNETITCLANKLTYNGKLKCANDKVRTSTLKMNKQLNYPSWLNTVLSSEIEDSVVVLDTGVSDSTLCINQKEVDVILKILAAFRQNFGVVTLPKILVFHIKKIIDIGHVTDNKIQKLMENLLKLNLRQWIIEIAFITFDLGGIIDNQIGIIAPYRAQVLLLRNAQKDVDFNVEVNTIDQYQGRDKDIILYSCTQSDKAKVKETCILGDKNRMTVAITRARYKLIIIGNVQTLQCYSVFQKLFHSLPQNKILSLE